MLLKALLMSQSVVPVAVQPEKLSAAEMTGATAGEPARCIPQLAEDAEKRLKYLFSPAVTGRFIAVNVIPDKANAQ